MAEQTAVPVVGTCFVVMGFGKKTDFETGRTLDLDKSYRNLIKPSAEAAGLKCIRADEIVHSGLIDVPMYDQLLTADVVVADLSTSNKNAFYELGVRHALRPHTTLVIAEDGIKSFPFDVNHVAIRQYHHLGEDIGVDEARRFSALLTDAIKEILKKNPPDKDSPVYTLLHQLLPPSFADKAALLTTAVQAKAEAEVKAVEPGSTSISQSDLTKAMATTHAVLMQQIGEAEDAGDFIKAKSLLSCVSELIKGSASDRGEVRYITQRLALATSKSKYPNEEAALKEAREILSALDPKSSNDTETLGLWGSLHKRLWKITQDAQDLDTAVRAYGRGFYLRNDYYNGINFAYLLNVRAAHTVERAEAITDFILARRVRKEVLTICQDWLSAHPTPDGPEVSLAAMDEYLKIKYWVLATVAEGYLGLGEDDKAADFFKQAETVAPPKTSVTWSAEQLQKLKLPDWMKQSTREQMEQLKNLLAQSPLGYIKSDNGG